MTVRARVAATLFGFVGVLLALALLAPAAQAHFLLNINIRVIHVQHLDDGLRVLLRLPMPYVVAQLTGAPRADGTVAPAPYTTNRREDGALMHYLDLTALRADPMGLGQLVADGHDLMVEGTRLPASVEQVRVFPGLSQQPFATLDEAIRAFDAPLYPDDTAATFVGDTVVDVMLRYRTGGAVYAYSFGSTLDPGLEGQDETANLLLDHFPGEALVFRERGLLQTPIDVTRSALAAAYTFVVEGVRHILEGTDHVLFVLCLTIGAVGFKNLLWRVTGFTLGHTVTLIVGFLGYAPSAPWFIPAVEAGIALSIIYAGVIAVMNRPGAGTFIITAAIGLLHGLGFSFVLHEILRVDAPNLWQSLLSFNLGVEVGQVAIVLLVWPLLWLLARRGARWLATGRWIVALPCITLAALWTGERVMMILEATAGG